MIISKIIGGLGNQMFQYAVGACLADEWKLEFKQDLSGFNNYRLHNGFELDKVFNISINSADERDIALICGDKDSLVNKVLWRLFSIKRSALYLEKSFSFTMFPDYLKKGCYLDGYWQSERYFLGKSSLVRDLFVFKNNLDPHNMLYFERASKTNSVSVHVRRGDYVSNKEANKVHGVCGKRYYLSAIENIKNSTENPLFFVFSDDIDWCKKELSFIGPNVVYVEGNSGTNSWQDMKLMSVCKHNIIANSSFSWWGAWLNSNIDKIVIAPTPWFLATTIDTRDVLPPQWIKEYSDFDSNGTY